MHSTNNHGRDSRLGSLLLLLNQLHSHRGADKALQLGRRSSRIRPTAHSHDVPRDLQRREKDAPRNAPPAQKEREHYPAGLAFARATPAHDYWSVARSGHHARRPDAIHAMDIDRTWPAAFRALPLVQACDFIEDSFLGHLGGHLHDESIFMAAPVAVARIPIANPAKQDRSFAIRTSGHGFPFQFR